MLFNSIDFALFLPIVFCLYWLIPKQQERSRNALLLLASYFFYGLWDWRFLSLIIFSTLVDYVAGQQMVGATGGKKRLFLSLSLVVNLGLLGVFKYYNFFVENLVSLLEAASLPMNFSSLNVILPVGISFYTFQTLSYSIDVYRGKLEPTKDLLAFAAYVSFFPQLVAGPIERATKFLPQFHSQKKFDLGLATEGLKQMLWGLVKKVVIADSCAIYVNRIFEGHEVLSGSTLFLGAVLFAFQIYGDFSGYSDIAIGTAKLFGFRLMKNFAFPYFSRDIAEFWRRWHISLSTWFRDYLYIPIGGSRGGMKKSLRNVFIVFVVSGFWHGANWTFIIWGALNAAYFIPLMLAKKNRKNTDEIAGGRFFPTFRDGLSILGTFGLTCLAWVFFRATDVHHAMDYLGGIFSLSLFSVPEIFPKMILCYILLFLGVEWMGRHDEHGMEKSFNRLPTWLRYGIYYVLIIAVLYYGGSEQEFIYFQF